MDGEKTNYSGAYGMSAPAVWANAQKKAEKGQLRCVKSVRVSQKNTITSGELLLINSRFCGGYSELPWRKYSQ